MLLAKSEQACQWANVQSVAENAAY
jgi:hypothetical protein